MSRSLETPDPRFFERISLLSEETQWRQRPIPGTWKSGQPARVSLSRWSSVGRTPPFETTSDDSDDSHVVTLRLRQTSGELSIAGRTMFSGHRRAGGIFLTGPKGEAWRATFLKPFDHLRIYLPQSVMAETYEACFGRSPAASISLLQIGDTNDELLGNLMRAALEFEAHGHFLGPSFLDSLALTISARLFALHEGKHLSQPAGRLKALSKSRLDKVLEYIDAYLSRPIYLAELCEEAGLSRIQFASEFRIATGHPPYAYIIRRRIAVAQKLLRNPNRSIADIALEVGFSSQAHFTDAFRRLCSVTPAEWRNSLRP
jgi:AraC family transcriptional regulator